jgi:hypothetical protein
VGCDKMSHLVVIFFSFMCRLVRDRLNDHDATDWVVGSSVSNRVYDLIANDGIAVMRGKSIGAVFKRQ